MACSQQVLGLDEGGMALSPAPLLLGPYLGLKLGRICLDPLLLNVLHAASGIYVMSCMGRRPLNCWASICLHGCEINGMSYSNVTSRGGSRGLAPAKCEFCIGLRGLWPGAAVSVTPIFR